MSQQYRKTVSGGQNNLFDWFKNGAVVSVHIYIQMFVQKYSK